MNGLDEALDNFYTALTESDDQRQAAREKAWVKVRQVLSQVHGVRPGTRDDTIWVKADDEKTVLVQVNITGPESVEILHRPVDRVVAANIEVGLKSVGFRTKRTGSEKPKFGKYHGYRSGSPKSGNSGDSGDSGDDHHEKVQKMGRVWVKVRQMLHKHENWRPGVVSHPGEPVFIWVKDGHKMIAQIEFSGPNAMTVTHQSEHRKEGEDLEQAIEAAGFKARRVSSPKPKFRKVR